MTPDAPIALGIRIDEATVENAIYGTHVTHLPIYYRHYYKFSALYGAKVILFLPINLDRY